MIPSTPSLTFRELIDKKLADIDKARAHHQRLLDRALWLDGKDARTPAEEAELARLADRFTPQE